MADVRRALRDKSHKVGLVDVARRAGVSIATVSRVLNKVGQVSADTRRRVERTALELDYAPNSFARAMAAQKSHTIGVIVPSLRGSIFAAGVEAMQSHAQKQGYCVLLACCDFELDRELELARQLVARGVDGLVLVGFLHHPGLMPMLARRGIPCVLQGVWRRHSSVPCVGFDNVSAMEVMTRYMIGLGHRRIGVLSGLLAGNDRVQDRLVGVRRALADAQVDLPPQFIVESAYDLGAARRGAARLLDVTPRPTAILGFNDVLAHGALLEAQTRGLQVPDHLSISGFDDLDFAAHLQPPLTTMRVPLDQMGARAIDALLAAMGEKPTTRRILPIRPELLARGSTAPPST